MHWKLQRRGPFKKVNRHISIPLRPLSPPHFRLDPSCQLLPCQRGGLIASNKMTATARHSSVSEAVGAASVTEQNVDPVESKSSLSSTDKEVKNVDGSKGAASVAMPHLLAHDEDQDWIVDAQAGAVGATWKHRVPALLMILFLTRKCCSSRSLLNSPSF